jgi:hypothetical protein
LIRVGEAYKPVINGKVVAGHATAGAERIVNGEADGANHHYYKVYNSGIQLKVGTYSLTGSAPLLRLVSKRCRRHHYIRRMIPGYNVLHSSIQL